jgi:hypothetical protein
MCIRPLIRRVKQDAKAYATDRPLKLYTQCDRHAIAWVANETERNQIREYTGAVNVSACGANARARARAGPLLRIV